MSRIVTSVLSLLLVALLSASVAVAADAKGKGGKRPDPAQTFKMIAKEKDSFTLEDLKASEMGKRLGDKAETFFKHMDGNSDGKVTLEEFKTAAAKRAEQMKNKKKN